MLIDPELNVPPLIESCVISSLRDFTPPPYVVLVVVDLREWLSVHVKLAASFNARIIFPVGESLLLLVPRLKLVVEVCVAETAVASIRVLDDI